MSEPWEIPNTPWKDEKAYFNWLRGSVRRIWSRHPVKIAYKQQRRYKAPIGINGKEVWCSDCELCGRQSRNCEVDHLEGGYGFKDWQSFTEWAKMILWVTFDDIRELCKECHQAVSLSQKQGISFEEALIEKQIIAIMKEKQDSKWLKDNGVVPASNAAGRRKQIKQRMEEINDG